MWCGRLPQQAPPRGDLLYSLLLVPPWKLDKRVGASKLPS